METYMIIFSKINTHGRLGNQLWNIAAMIGFSKKYNVGLNLPNWNYAKYFKFPYVNVKTPSGVRVSEKDYHYTPEFYDSLDWSKDMDFFGYFQTKKYWEHCELDVMKAFEFEEKFRNKVADKYREVFKKRTIAISCRIGDYRNNSEYVVLPAMYYILALYENFPNWKDCNLIFLSDDINWARLHFGCLSNAYFANDFDDKNYFFSETAVEQLCLMSMADDFIIANSTFSEWGAMLGEKNGSKVVRPAHYMAGKLKQRCDMKDHYPEHWTEFDHSGKKYDLGDVTFVMPCQYDHPDREANIGLSVCMLLRDFKTNISIGEINTTRFARFGQWAKYKWFKEKFFHRTKIINELCREAETEVVVNYDVDILLPPMSVICSYEKIKSGQADFVYPYQFFARVPRKPHFAELEKHLDVGILAGIQFKGMSPGDAISVGGCIFMNRKTFFKSGGENEEYRSYGNEDVERKFRWDLLGFKVERINGTLFHCDHYIGTDSTNKHPNGKSNWAVWDKVSKMNKEEMLEYVASWTWNKKK